MAGATSAVPATPQSLHAKAKKKKQGAAVVAGTTSAVPATPQCLHARLAAARAAHLRVAAPCRSVSLGGFVGLVGFVGFVCFVSLRTLV